MNKIKILHSGETTGALSGFGKYGREVITRLAQNDRFEIAELASFGSMEDDKFHHINGRWRYYPNHVNPGHPLCELYNSNPGNAFGTWRFERCCLDFKPDHVFTIRDPWNDYHVCRSPFRKFFHLSFMPTVDSAPQQVEWIEQFKDCDSIFTYSDWAIPVLKEQSGGSINPICSTYPGVDLNIFKPLDKKAIREYYGIPQDAYIIGMVCRNQRRKLLPELFKMFRKYLDKYGNTEIGKKTYLYLHTSYPEPPNVGWDFPALLTELGIGNRVYFTYYCRESKRPFCSKFEGAQTFSIFTQRPTAFPPNVGSGLTEPQLAEIHNLFDLYVQYANCEGSGMPQLEAAACGTPIASVNYSAMADVVEKTQGIALKPASIPRDIDLGADRAIPDNDFAADAIYKHFTLDKSYRAKKSKQARQAAETYFNWDRTAKIWSDHFENIELTGLQGKWDVPIQIQDDSIPTPPPNLSNVQFVLWCATAVGKDPELAIKYFGLEWLNKLNMGLDRNVVYENFKVLGINKIQWEKARVGLLQLNPNEDWINFAKIIQGN